MRIQTEGAVDAVGNLLQVHTADTSRTIEITLGADVGDSSPKEIVFTKSGKEVMPYALIEAADNKAVVLRSLVPGYGGSFFAVEVNDADAEFALTFIENLISITPKATTTCAELVSAINNNPLLKGKITALTDGTTEVITPEQAKTYLKGWDSGAGGTLVRIYNDSDEVCFVGNFPESEEGEASMPIPGKSCEYVIVDVGEKLVFKGEIGDKVYLTPTRNY